METSGTIAGLLLQLRSCQAAAGLAGNIGLATCDDGVVGNGSIFLFLFFAVLKCGSLHFSLSLEFVFASCCLSWICAMLVMPSHGASTSHGHTCHGHTCSKPVSHNLKLSTYVNLLTIRAGLQYQYTMPAQQIIL